MALATSPSPFAVMKRRNFALLWTGQFVETIGASLTSLAASILVYRLTGGSAFAVGLMLMATAAPSLLLGLVAGVYVDRYDRRRIMIIADILRAGLVLLVPFLVDYGIGWLYAIIAVISSVGQFFDPAYESVLPDVAPDEELAAANSMIAVSSFGSTAIGFAASGLIAANYPIEYAFYLNGFAYLFSAVCVMMTRLPKAQPVEEKTSVQLIVTNLKSGLDFLFKNPVLRSLFYLSIPIAVSFGLSNSLLLPFATRALQADEFAYGLQEGLTSVGFVASSLLMATLLNRWREGQWIVVSLIGMGIASIIYSQLSIISLAIAIQMLSGFMNSPMTIASRLLRQRNTVPEVRGRVSSASFVASNLFFLIGMAAAGLADIMDVRVLYLVGGGVITLLCGFWAMTLPGIGQPAAEWRRALSLLRTAPATTGMGVGRAVLPADMDILMGLLPPLAELPRADRDRVITQGRVYEVPPETRVMTAGEVGEAAYFILSGKAVAGVAEENNSYHSLSTMTAGDYFGEIGALTGAKRTADVVAADETLLLEVPASILRVLMNQPAFSKMVLTRMSERLARTSIRDLPRFAGVDAQTARELREESTAPAVPQAEPAAV